MCARQQKRVVGSLLPNREGTDGVLPDPTPPSKGVGAPHQCPRVNKKIGHEVDESSMFSPAGNDAGSAPPTYIHDGMVEICCATEWLHLPCAASSPQTASIKSARMGSKSVLFQLVAGVVLVPLKCHKTINIERTSV